MVRWGRRRGAGRPLLACLVLLAGLSGMGGARADERPPTAMLKLETGKGTLVRLPAPAATVFIADPDTADVQVKSPGIVYVMAKSPGETVLYAVDAAEKPLYSATIRVLPNLSHLQEQLRAALPDERIEVTALDGVILLRGTVSSAAHAEDARALAQVIAQKSRAGTVINQLAVAAPNQVNLRIRIIEIRRNTLKNLGVNFESLLQGSRFNFGLLTANPVTQTGNLVRDTAILRWTKGATSASAIIDALAQEGLVTVLAEPNLTALSGQTASFLAGGEFPVPVANEVIGGVANVRVEFKKFGVALDFTPTILDGSRINLRVRPEVSELTDTGAVQLNGFNIPALSVRRAETTVELGSGESFALAGLIENNAQLDISKIPGLGDVPVLGPLFRSDRFRRNETELAILATPYVVRPTSPAALAGASDPLKPPSGAAHAPGLVGPAGFVLD